MMCEGFSMKESSNKHILVSITILIYKNFEYLQDSIWSCFNQTYPLIEIIFSDDGSPEFDEEKIKRLCINKPANIRDIKIRHSKENHGTVHNFNQAVNLCDGEIIVSLAADDCLYNKTTVKDIVDCFQRTNSLILASKQIHKTDKTSIILPFDMDKKILKKGDPYEVWHLISAFPCCIYGSCAYFKKEVFIKYGKCDENYKLLEDWPFFLRVLENNERIGFLDKVTLIHRTGGISTPRKGRRVEILIDDDIRCIRHTLSYTGWPQQTWFHKRMLKYRLIQLEYEKGVRNTWFSIWYMDVIAYKTIRKTIRKIYELHHKKRI